MQTQSPGPDTSFVPNEIYVRIRKFYLMAVLGAMPTLFLGLLIVTSKSGFEIFSLLFFAAGGGLLIYALILRAAAKCPRCVHPLMWRSGPVIGTGRVSLGVKSHCPNCKLDLNQVWHPGAIAANGPAEEQSSPR